MSCGDGCSDCYFVPTPSEGTNQVYCSKCSNPSIFPTKLGACTCNDGNLDAGEECDTFDMDGACCNSDCSGFNAGYYNPDEIFTNQMQFYRCTEECCTKQ